MRVFPGAFFFFCITWREDELIIHVDRHVTGHHVWEQGWDCVQMLKVGFHSIHRDAPVSTIQTVRDVVHDLPCHLFVD